MQVKISPSEIAGKFHVSASKSSMQRACAAALLHNGTTHIKSPGHSNDDKASLNIIKQLGAKTFPGNEAITVTSGGFPANNILQPKMINCGESGLSFRMFAPIAALSSVELILTGEGSLLKRPMNFFDDVLPELRVKVNSNKGFMPVGLTGPLIPADISIDGSLSSQFLTGLLFAFGSSAKNRVVISVNDLKSKPYIDLSLDVMKHFGYAVTHENYKSFFIAAKEVRGNDPIIYNVERDWSSASFLLVAAAIAGTVSLSGLNMRSTQADKAIMDVLKNCGADVEISDDVIRVSKKDLNPFQFDATHCPDLFPPLVALAAYCSGTSVIKGIHRLAAKESNRAETLQNVFSRMGVEILLQNDEMIIKGGKPLCSADVSSHHDHRIAMAAAVAGLGAAGSITISHAEAVNKSYPEFYTDLKRAGADLEITEP